MKNNYYSHSKDNAHLRNYKKTSSYIRANELVPEADENELCTWNDIILKNYNNPNFIYQTQNIYLGLNGIFPFDSILSLNTKLERRILYSYYERGCSLEQISNVFDMPISKIKYFFKVAHSRFYRNLREYGKILYAVSKLDGDDDE